MRTVGSDSPYPLAILRGRLRLSGLTHLNVESVLAGVAREFKEYDSLEEDDIIEACRGALIRIDKDALDRFDILTAFEALRRDPEGPPPLILVLEGASATGKSLLAISMMQNMTATRFISTDTIRQVLRGQLSQEEYPELFCHTYQAHKHRQVGPDQLEPVVRGFLAQWKLIAPAVREMVQKIIFEGADAIIEGVHIVPGSLFDISPGIIEVIINPSLEAHRSMFIEKHETGKLRSVSDDSDIREDEFDATRSIQAYMIEKAQERGVPIIELDDYNNTEAVLSELVIKKAKDLL